MASSSKRNRRSRPGPGQVRIIAGRWRGRKLAVPDVQGLRPSGDRVRETLFNWLQGDVAGAHCLDLFAGTGALGLEALSRYASSATFVELDTLAMAHIEQACRELGVQTTIRSEASDHNSTQQISMKRASTDQANEDPQGQAHSDLPRAELFRGAAEDALAQLRRVPPAATYDLVFIDPPFQRQCQWEVLAGLEPSLLGPEALVYIEAPTSQSLPDKLPQGFETVREKMFSDVTARLVHYNPR